MCQIFGDHTQGIQKRMLAELESNAMFVLIGPIFCGVPFEIRHRLAIITYVLITIFL